MELGNVLNKVIKSNQNIFIHFGVVTARTNTNTRISLTISGGSTAITGVRYLSSYTPTVSDVVVCLFNDKDIIVLGKLV
jgi:hypothetical protein